MNSNFSGSTRDGLFILIELHRKYKDQCVLLSGALDTLRYPISQRHPEMPVSWYDLGVVWWRDILHVPDGFFTRVSKCKSTFVLVPFTLISPNKKVAHANFLILHTLHATVEHYEPYGNTPPIYIPGDEGDALLSKALQDMAYRLFGKWAKLEQPIKSTPVQLKQESEMKMQSIDPGGYCLAWSAFFADVRLAEGMMPSTAMPAIIHRLLQKHEDNLTSYIRSFSKRLKSLDSREIVTEKYLRKLVVGDIY